MSILKQNLLTLDFWQDKVTYGKQTAAVMKRLAKDKLERAIFDHAYAKGSYEAEMSQTALLNEARKKL